jgi:hypothetical protein
MMVPLAGRRRELPSFSGIVKNLHDTSDVMPSSSDAAAVISLPGVNLPVSSISNVYDDGSDSGSEFPMVRR